MLVDKPRTSWGVAAALKVDENRVGVRGADVVHIQRSLADEMGEDFPLSSVLDYGIGLHHSGLKNAPVTDTFQPCVRCPPLGS